MSGGPGVGALFLIKDILWKYQNSLREITDGWFVR